MEFDFKKNGSFSRKDKIMEAVKEMNYEKLENLSKKFSEMRLEQVNQYHSYMCFLFLILISLSNTLQRGIINSMYSYSP